MFEQRVEPCRARRNLLRATEEIAAQFLVAVAVDAEVHAGGLHVSPHVPHLRAACRVGRRPLAVEVGASRVGARMPEGDAVGIHVGHDVHNGALEKPCRDGVVCVE